MAADSAENIPRYRVAHAGGVSQMGSASTPVAPKVAGSGMRRQRTASRAAGTVPSFLLNASGQGISKKYLGVGILHTCNAVVVTTKAIHWAGYLASCKIVQICGQAAR